MAEAEVPASDEVLDGDGDGDCEEASEEGGENGLEDMKHKKTIERKNMETLKFQGKIPTNTNAITQRHNFTQCCTMNQQVVTTPTNVLRQTSRNLPNDTTPPNVQLHPLLHDKQAGNYPGRYILMIMCGQMHGVCFTGCGSIFLLKPNFCRCFRCIYRHGTLS
jgi:hypothetical protein